MSQLLREKEEKLHGDTRQSSILHPLVYMIYKNLLGHELLTCFSLSFTLLLSTDLDKLLHMIIILKLKIEIFSKGTQYMHRELQMYLVARVKSTMYNYYFSDKVDHGWLIF